VRVPDGSNSKDYGYGPGTVTFQWYRQEVEEALNAYFGAKNVKGGNKAFDIHGLGVDADAVPALMFHNFRNESGFHMPKVEGIAFDTRTGERVENYPHQALRNGIRKNMRTGRAYKRCVRILKRSRNILQDEGVEVAENNPSFQIESLLYNVDDVYFGESTWYETMRNVLKEAYSVAQHSGSPKEVNEIKPLFGSHSSWTREKACLFLSAVWTRLGYSK
jgi:hypothetical protein